jgi:ribosomal protein S18 acetylase RimI-like enzyme
LKSLRGRIRAFQSLPGVEVRFSEEADGEYWAKWLLEPDVQVYYPMANDRERKESVERMQAYARFKCALTALFHGKVAGIAYVNLHPYRKIAHQALFTIIIGEEFRGQGIGGLLLEHLERLCKQSYGIEVLHLEVYEGNPAIRLYRRRGYVEFGFQSHWIKEGPGEYRGKISMEKQL